MNTFPGRSFPIALILIAACALGWSGQAPAQDISVQSATPSSAAQGTIGLLVTIKGSGFPRNPGVQFCVSGTSCNADKITVRSVKLKGSGTIETVIDVAVDDALVDTLFDVVVIEPLSGRKGRGTSLFTVLKSNGNSQDIGPDPVLIEAVDPIANAVSLRWQIPAGGNVGETVTGWDVRYSTSPLTPSNFEEAPRAPGSEMLVAGEGAPNGEYLSVRNLVQDTTYWFGIRAVNNNGEVSDLVPGSFTSVTTRHTTATQHAQTWTQDTVQSVLEYPEASGSNGCCRYARIDIDGNGEPATLYEINAGTELATGVRYAYRSGTGWVVENAYPDILSYTWGLSSLRHAPPAGVAGIAAGAPMFIESHQVTVDLGKGQLGAPYQSTLVHRTSTGTWVREVLPLGILTASEPDLSLYRDGESGTWVPVLTSAPAIQLDRKTSTRQFSIVERRVIGGVPTWVTQPVFDCRAFAGTSVDIAAAAGVRGTADGRLYVLTSVGGPAGNWFVFGVRQADGSWRWRRSGTGLSMLSARGTNFTVDSSGEPYIAAMARIVRQGTDQVDVVFIDAFDLQPVPANGSPCEPPGFDALATAEMVDSGARGDVFADGRTDGPILDDAGWVAGTAGVALEYLDGAQHPAVHVMFDRDDGWHDIREQRVLSRCGGPGSGWVRDAVDRAHGGAEALFMNGPAFGIAWAHHVGHHSDSNNYTSRYDSMLLAKREGSVCSSP